MTTKCHFCDDVANDNNLVYRDIRVCDACYKTRCFYCAEEYALMNDVKLTSYNTNSTQYYFIYDEEEYNRLINQRRGSRCSCSSSWPTYILCKSLSKICDYCIYKKTKGLKYTLCQAVEKPYTEYITYDRYNIDSTYKIYFDDINEIGNMAEIDETNANMYNIDSNFSKVNDAMYTIDKNFDKINTNVYKHVKAVNGILNKVINDFYNYKLTTDEQIKELKVEIDNLKESKNLK